MLNSITNESSVTRRSSNYQMKLLHSRLQNMMLKLSLLVLLYLIPMSHAFQPVRLQGVAVRGKLICGNQPLHNAKVKIVDVDQSFFFPITILNKMLLPSKKCFWFNKRIKFNTGPDMDDLMGEVNTDKNGLFKVSGATREDSDIEVVLKIYHDCLDEFRVVFMIITYI